MWNDRVDLCTHQTVPSVESVFSLLVIIVPRKDLAVHYTLMHIEILSV